MKDRFGLFSKKVDPSSPPPTSYEIVAKECFGTPIRSVVPSAIHNCFVTASNDGAVRCWSVEEAKLLRGVFCGGESYLFAVAVSSDLAYAGGDDGVLFAFKLPSLEPLFRVAHPAEIWTIALAPPGAPNAGDVIVGCEEPYGCFVWTSVAERALSMSQAMTPSQQATQVAKAVDLAPPRPLEGAAAASKGRTAEANDGSVSVGSTGADGRYDFSFPVELGQGQPALTLNWNRGDDPNMVAYQFMNQHRISSDQFDHIIEFISQAQGGGIGASPQTTSPAVSSAGFTLPAPEVQGQMIAQVMSLGVDEAAARAAFDRTGWVSVEAAISSIFGT